MGCSSVLCLEPPQAGESVSLLLPTDLPTQTCKTASRCPATHRLVVAHVWARRAPAVGRARVLSPSAASSLSHRKPRGERLLGLRSPRRCCAMGEQQCWRTEVSVRGSSCALSPGLVLANAIVTGGRPGPASSVPHRFHSTLPSGCAPSPRPNKPSAQEGW